MIHSASRQALAAVRERLNRILGDRRDGAVNERLSAELDSVAGLLSVQPTLRRTLADASTDAENRATLVRALLGGKVSDETLDVVAAVASERWSSPWDLTDAVEILGDDALLAAADDQGKLDEVEDELFRFERILSDNSALVAALDEVSVPAERRLGLLHSVLDGKVDPITYELVAHSVSSSRKVSLQLAIDDLLQASAVRRDRSVARVVSARELTAQQSQRLAAALSAMYGREIAVRSAVDPSVGGGLQVRVGDEVIDGTVATRMAAARAALVH